MSHSHPSAPRPAAMPRRRTATAERDRWCGSARRSRTSPSAGLFRGCSRAIRRSSAALSIRAVGYDLEGPRAVDVGASGTTTVDLTLRPAPDVEAQLTNAEWLESIPGTNQQKAMFDSCVRCHTIDRVLRSRYDAEAWLHVLERMDGYVTSAFPGQPAETSRGPGHALCRAERAAAGG